MKPVRFTPLISALLACVSLTSCTNPVSENKQSGPALATTEDHSVIPASHPAPPATNPAGSVLHVADLHNVHQLTPAIYCGSVPNTEEEFKALSALGVKTIITVDGAKPSADLAEKCGLRYVHLPFGYDGIPRKREIEIVRAVRDLPGPIYIHCHHGLHRGPAAAAVAAEASAGWSPQEAVAALQAIGTSPHYEGLYAAARDFRKPTDAELNSADASFPRIAKLDDLADTMVEVDHRWDHLKAAQKAAWTTPKDQPDVDPAHEALMLKELLREAHRPGGPAEGRPADLVERMVVAEQSASSLEDALRAKDCGAAEKAAKVMQESCTACHVRYRDRK